MVPEILNKFQNKVKRVVIETKKAIDFKIIAEITPYPKKILQHIMPLLSQHHRKTKLRNFLSFFKNISAQISSFFDDLEVS